MFHEMICLYNCNYVCFQATISFTWGGWSDDLSGLSHYQYQLFDLVSMTGGLMDGFAVKESGNLPNGSFSVSNLI